MFYVLAIVICNVIEGAQMTQGINSEVGKMTQYEQPTSTDSNQNKANFWNVGADVFSTIGKVITFDYTIFKDMKNVDPVTGLAPANDFSIFRYLLMAIGAVLAIEIAIVFKQIISK